MRKTLVSSSLLRLFAAFIILTGFGTVNVNASGGGHKEKSPHGEKVTPISEVIIEHVMDSHDWHLADVGETAIALHLPWIIYNSEKGLQFFGSTHSMVEEDHHYMVHHEQLYYVKDNHHPVYDGPAEGAHAYEEAKDKYVVVHAEYAKAGADGEKEITEIATVYEKMEGVTVIDFSMTKTALHILIVALIMMFVFIRIAKAYKKREGQAPKGMQSFFEPLILFVREDICKPFLHGKHDRFVPYFLTLFFFIWIANIMGLMPLASNIAGNTTITVMLALLTFILIIANSTKDFWMHIFWFPGVPLWMKPLMLVVELMGFITKPVALAIRLFANISAGHFMVLSLISLIFILGNNGESVGGAVGIMPLSILFSLFIFAVELIVAAVQAFVFCLLTAVFIGQAMETHDHMDEHHDARDIDDSKLAHA